MNSDEKNCIMRMLIYLHFLPRKKKYIYKCKSLLFSREQEAVRLPTSGVVERQEEKGAGLNV